MKKLRDTIERLLFGYTAEERAAIQRRYIDWRIETVIVDSLERLSAEDDAADDAEDDAEDKATGETAPAEGEVHP